jgi:hypothetical protein
MALRLDNVGIVVEDLEAAIKFSVRSASSWKAQAWSRASGQGASPASATKPSRSP